MLRPLISIIVPVYGVEEFICECLMSVRQQSYDNYECIIVNDCTTDNSIIYATQLISDWGYDNRFKIVYRKGNGGLSAARNTGIDSAKGKYIYFLDGDDKLMPDALMSMVKTINKYPTVQMVQGNVIYENQKEVWQFSSSDFPEYSDDRNWIQTNMLQWKISISAWNKLYRTDYLRDNNLKFQEGIIHEDVKWCWDNQKKLRSIAFNDYKCYWYRICNQNSIMHDVDKTRSALSFLDIFDSIKEDINDETEIQFIKDYILPYKVSIYRFSLCKNRILIRNRLKNILHSLSNSILRQRCIALLFMLYIFPFNLVKNKYR